MTSPAPRDPNPTQDPAIERRLLLGGALGALAACSAAGSRPSDAPAAPRATARAQRAPSAELRAPERGPVLVGSANALPGMQRIWPTFAAGGDPLDAAIEVVKVVEADPNDHSVGLGGLPNEDGVVQLDAACMHGPTHHSGAVGALENILHPSEVARRVLERTDHCLLVGAGAYRFARAHGFAHTELLTDEAREIWLRWKESHSREDDWLGPEELGPPKTAAELGRARAELLARLGRGEQDLDWSGGQPRLWGTIHCSALSTRGELACCTTTSGLSFKIPGRVGDSPIVGAGLYCDQEAGSAGATGRGEANILANGGFALVELMRGGMPPQEAALEVLRRVLRQTQRMARWQPGLIGPDGQPSFNLHYYAVALDGSWGGAALKPGGEFAVADRARGPRLEPLASLPA